MMPDVSSGWLKSMPLESTSENQTEHIIVVQMCNVVFWCDYSFIVKSKHQALLVVICLCVCVCVCACVRAHWCVCVD